MYVYIGTWLVLSSYSMVVIHKNYITQFFFFFGFFVFIYNLHYSILLFWNQILYKNVIVTHKYNVLSFIKFKVHNAI